MRDERYAANEDVTLKMFTLRHLAGRPRPILRRVGSTSPVRHEVAWQHGAFVAARSAVSALHQRVMAG